MVKSTESLNIGHSLGYESKVVSILAALLLMISLGSSTDLNNIESITPSGTNPISITGNLDMNNNNINNFFGSSCSTGNIVAHINDDGTLDCVDATGEVQNDFVDRSGDSMTGSLDMSGNNVNNVNKLQLNNIESVSDGQIGRDNSIGYLGNWGSNGNAVLWDSYNVQEGNAISITGGTGDESNPQIAVNEGGINHDNIAGVSYNDHHSVGNGLTWDGSRNTAISSGGVGSYEIASGSVSTTELNTGSVDSRYVNKNGDSMSGNLDLATNSVNLNTINFKPDGSDPYSLTMVEQGNNDHELRLKLNDDYNERFAIFGNSCDTADGCSGVGQTLFNFTSNGDMDIIRGQLDMNNNNINNVNNIYGNSGSDIEFQNRPRSQDGLYIDSGTAYFDGYINVDEIRDMNDGEITLHSDVRTTSGFQLPTGADAY